MNWQVEFLPEAEQDIGELDGSVKAQVFKGIVKVSQNPLPQSEGGYGKPLGNKGNLNLANLLKIKFRDIGIRVVYKVIREDTIMKILVVSARTDEKVYKEAAKRRRKYDL
ncbi:MAG: type II toxin-antitoxin system RelE/ParE family toxin [Oscillospiraceae bacterium]|nr:type II toxin-antitoxin system RelE/ParE family toxin [Oscillospiraceae bacterium]